MTVYTLLLTFIMVEHFLFMLAEMFAFKETIGRDSFKKLRKTAAQVENGAALTEQATQMVVSLAQNMGLYNGFLAAGLFWACTVPDPSMALALQKFFLSCVAIAGVFGAITAKRQILYVQAVPAFVALWLLRGLH